MRTFLLAIILLVSFEYSFAQFTLPVSGPQTSACDVPALTATGRSQLAAMGKLPYLLAEKRQANVFSKIHQLPMLERGLPNPQLNAIHLIGITRVLDQPLNAL